jgi:hypothetical protein
VDAAGNILIGAIGEPAVLMVGGCEVQSPDMTRTNAATRHLLGWAALVLVLLVPFAALEREPVLDADSVSTAAVLEAPSVASTNAPDAATPLAPPRGILQLHEGDWLAVAMLSRQASTLLQL